MATILKFIKEILFYDSFGYSESVDSAEVVSTDEVTHSNYEEDEMLQRLLKLSEEMIVNNDVFINKISLLIEDVKNIKDTLKSINVNK